MRIFAIVAAVLSAAGAWSENLFPRGDFDNAAKSLAGDVTANGGDVSLFVEDGNWNRCCKLTVSRTYTNEDSSVVYSACAFLGGDSKRTGIPVKGDTLYDFSFEVRSDTVKGVGVHFQDWQTGVWAKDSRNGKTSLGSVFVRPGWSRYKGTFRTHAGAKFAALSLQLWQSTKYPPVSLNVGDYILIDNVKVEEAHDLAKALLSGGAAKAPAAPVARVKAIRDGETFDDFLLLSCKKGAVDPFTAPTRATLYAGEKEFRLRVVCEEPKEVRPGTPEDLWAADVLEVYFGPAPGNPDRMRTQFAWNPAGAKTVLKDGTEMSVWATCWKVETRMTEKGYVSVAEIPYDLLGFKGAPTPGETIALNVCRTRGVTKAWGCWAPVKDGFGEVGRFGWFVFGTWNDALRLTLKCAAQATNREEYELAVQKVETERRDAKFNALKGKPFTVARVSPTSDFGCPFTPVEAFEPADCIDVKAAVNEVTGLPVAILNLTDRTEEYVVRLETCTDDPKQSWRAGYDGAYGLRGLEPERVTLRRALRFKDTEQAPCTVRYDPLPEAGDILTVSVPPKEAGVIWIDFNLTDAKPGAYAGRLRVIPLSESASFESVQGFNIRQYKGAMQDVPFALEIRPIVLPKQATRPGGFFQGPISRAQAKLMVEAGACEFQISPWSVSYAHDPATSVIDIARPMPEALKTIADIRRQVGWAKEFGVERPTFFVGFSSYHAALSMYGKKDLSADGKRRLFVEYVKALRHLMQEAGVAEEDFNIETFDEPDPKLADEMIAVHRTVKAAFPEVRLTLTMGASRTPISFFRRIAEDVDSWVLWDGFYFQQKENLDFNAEQIAKGRKVWHYTCSTSPRTPLYREYRLHAWFGAHHNLSGNQIFWFGDNIGGFGPPDFKVCTFGGLVYRNFDAFVPSIRYMNLRQSVQDVKYLDKLRAVAGDKPEVAAFLKDATRRVFLTEAHDPTTADRMREEAARLILQYQH